MTSGKTTPVWPRWRRIRSEPCVVRIRALKSLGREIRGLPFSRELPPLKNNSQLGSNPKRSPDPCYANWACVLLAYVPLPVSVKKHSSGEDSFWTDKLSKHQIRGWRALSAPGSQDKGSHKRSFYFTDTGIITLTLTPTVCPCLKLCQALLCNLGQLVRLRLATARHRMTVCICVCISISIYTYMYICIYVRMHPM